MADLPSMTIETDDKDGSLKACSGTMELGNKLVEFKNFGEFFEAYLKVKGLMDDLQAETGLTLG